MKVSTERNHPQPDVVELISSLSDDERHSIQSIVRELTQEERKKTEDMIVERSQDEKKTDTEANLVERLLDEHLTDAEHGSESRIIGGEEIEDLGQWPWLVSIQAELPVSTLFGFTLSSRDVYCGGSIVNEKFVLTAAHCFDGKKGRVAKYWEARMGDVDIKVGILDTILGLFGFDGRSGWEEEVENIIIYPGYDAEKTWENDIALMKLKSAIPSDNDNIKLVPLADQDDYMFPQDGAMCIMKGWGCTRAGGSISPVAKVLEMPKIADKTCKNTWGLSEMDTRVCAGYNLAGMGICAGDSGGPLVARNPRQEYVQIGIASFGAKNAPGDWPGAFTRVAHYVNWINDVINNNS